MAKKDLGTALITGAASGNRSDLCRQSRTSGYDLILVARNQERLEALASRLRKETNKSVAVVSETGDRHADSLVGRHRIRQSH